MKESDNIYSVFAETAKRRKDQAAIIYLPALQPIFKTTGLTTQELVVVTTLPWVVLVAVEIEKWLFRRGLIYR